MMREEVGDVGSSGKGFRLSSQGNGKVWMGFKEGNAGSDLCFCKFTLASLWKMDKRKQGGGREMI